MDPAISITLQGTMPSKKNAWKRGRYGGMYIEAGVKKELEVFEYELVKQRKKAKIINPLKGDIRVEVIFYINKLQVDDDNAYTTLQDLLQSSGIIKNDRMVYDHSARRQITKDPPMVEAHVYVD